MTSRIDYNNPHNEGELGLPYHYEMISDEKRIRPFKEAIKKVVKDKIVVESGTGTGILSLLAVQAGAKQVYAIELDPKIAAFTQNNFKKSGYQNITLIQKNTLEVTLDDIGQNRADVVIAENLSTWFVTEPQIQVMNHMVNKLGHENTICIPQEVRNQVELSQANYRFEDLVDLKTMYFEFSGLPKPKLLSKPYLAKKVIMKDSPTNEFSIAINIKVEETGTLNSVRLTSPLITESSFHFDQSDSLMPPIVYPLQEDISVKAGDEIQLEIDYQSNSSWDQFKVHARLQ